MVQFAVNQIKHASAVRDEFCFIYLLSSSGHTKGLLFQYTEKTLKLAWLLLGYEINDTTLKKVAHQINTLVTIFNLSLCWKHHCKQNKTKKKQHTFQINLLFSPLSPSSFLLAIDETQLGKRGYLTPMTAKEFVLALWKNEGNVYSYSNLYLLP